MRKYGDTARRLTDDQFQSDDLCDDDVFRHFEALEDHYWLTVAQEGRRVMSLRDGEEIEENSYYDDVIHAVSASAYEGALEKVAQALGMEAQLLEFALNEHEEEKKEDPDTPSLTIEGLQEQMRRAETFLKELWGKSPA